MATTNIVATSDNSQEGAEVTAPSMSKNCATYRKEICYDRETRDFACYLDGELMGFARNYHEGEVLLDRLVFELLSGGAFIEAA